MFYDRLLEFFLARLQPLKLLFSLQLSFLEKERLRLISSVGSCGIRMSLVELATWVGD